MWKVVLMVYGISGPTGSISGQAASDTSWFVPIGPFATLEDCEWALTGQRAMVMDHFDTVMRNLEAKHIKGIEIECKLLN